MEKTLGGERIGSGNKQKVQMHNFGMNSFNLTQDWKSTAAPGVLYPFVKCVGTNHGTFDIDLETIVRTLPTQGPLFGSFKMQLDLYSVPMRLYQGILHNNPINLGLNMNQVYLPKIKFATIDGKTAPTLEGATEDNCQINESSLCKYLGMSGLGHHANWSNQNTVISRKLQCVPFLGYYDIFKCYYANKQEENAYVIIPDHELQLINIKNVQMFRDVSGEWATISKEGGSLYYSIGDETWQNQTIRLEFDHQFETNNADLKQDIEQSTIFNFEWNNGTESADYNLNEISSSIITKLWYNENNKTYLQLTLYGNLLAQKINTDHQTEITSNIHWEIDGYEIEVENNTKYTSQIKLQPFKLSNIDEMRKMLLASNELGEEFVIEKNGDNAILPYSSLVERTNENVNYNAFALNGLVVKTYQSDLFNNWLSSEFVDTINEISAVDTSGGSFTMDSLNLAEKVYELLNRILVGGGTYQDWQEAVYGEGAIRMCETPMYIGGMSSEIMFEEVIATTDNTAENQALGSLGGRGREVGQKGGKNIHVKMDEPGYIIGIMSLTPRICFNQGNDWDLTELDTIDDLHKPSLDGIGFQDLMVEQFAWWNTVLDPSNATVIHRDSAGKQTAWINYQTAVDKSYGDFANKNSGFMVLNRNYEHVENGSVFAVKDITTYIDPEKYNYAFAVKKLYAQNFWIEIKSHITARRKMGAQQLPNL